MKMKTILTKTAGILLAAVLLATGAGSQNMAVQAAESSTESVSSDLAEGKYAVDVTLEGGSGRATISSPAILTVENGQATARIEWSSSHYDYMKVGDVQYDPVNEEGNSVFQIPAKGGLKIFRLICQDFGQLHKRIRITAFTSETKYICNPKSIQKLYASSGK